MKLGVVFPHWVIKPDPISIRDFAQAVEGMGYDYLLLYDVLTDTKEPNGWHEPFNLITYLAGITSKLEFATGIVVLPSRQTLLVAKQAAGVDVLTNGRLRFGVALGGNDKEYEAMGIEMSNRGKRIEEQITVLRKLWTEEFVTFEGKYHKLQGVRIAPQPVQQPMPIWFGGYNDAVLRRIARIGDGWMMYDETPDTARGKIASLHTYIQEAGRKPEDVQLNIVGVEIGEDKDWGQVVADWEAVGVTYLDVVTWKSELLTWDEYIGALRRFKESLDK